MIHARIDTVDHRQIVGFETGTRAQFDARHGGDPLWVFVESYSVKYRADFTDFQLRPWRYKVDLYGNVTVSTDPPIVVVEVVPVPPPGYYLLTGRDGRYLLSSTGDYLLGYDGNYTAPPAGTVYLMDPDGKFITDPDSVYLSETA